MSGSADEPAVVLAGDEPVTDTSAVPVVEGDAVALDRAEGDEVQARARADSSRTVSLPAAPITLTVPARFVHTEQFGLVGHHWIRPVAGALLGDLLTQCACLRLLSVSGGPVLDGRSLQHVVSLGECGGEPLNDRDHGLGEDRPDRAEQCCSGEC